MRNLGNNISKILLKMKVDKLARSFLNKKCSVLMYHGVVPDDCPINAWTLVKENEFRKQMDFLNRYYKVVDIGDLFMGLQDNDSGKPRAVITFDDGYRNNYSIAFPILQEYNFRATIFVCSGLLGQTEMAWYDKVIYAIQRSSCTSMAIGNVNFFFDSPNPSRRWDMIQELLTHLKMESEEERSQQADNIVRHLNVPLDQSECFELMSAEEARSLYGSGLVSIGSHTAYHEILTSISLSQAEDTIHESIRDLELLIGDAVHYFSYPNGNYNDEIISLLNAASITHACTTNSGIYSRRNSPYKIPRIGIGGYDTIDRFATKICGL